MGQLHQLLGMVEQCYCLHLKPKKKTLILLSDCKSVSQFLGKNIYASLLLMKLIML